MIVQQIMYISVMVCALDKEKGTSRLVCYLGKGDTFGELGILNQSPREITVISKSPVELLCLEAKVSFYFK